MTFEFPDGRTEAQTLSICPSETDFISALSADESQLPLYLQKRNSPYWFEMLKDNTVLYVQYNSCSELPNYPMAKFLEDLRSVIDEQLPQKLILDVRQNHGGNSSIILPFFEMVNAYPQLNTEDTFFTISGTNTFSSGVWALKDSKLQTKGFVIGSPSGGKPNNRYGDFTTFYLEHLDVVVSCSTKFFTFPQLNDAPSFDVDILIPDDAANFFAGKDPVLDYLFELSP